MFDFFRGRRRRQLLEQEVPAAWRKTVARNVAVFRRLSEDQRSRLLATARVIAAERHFEGCQGLQLTEEMRVTIAAQAALLVLGAGDYYFDRVAFECALAGRETGRVVIYYEVLKDDKFMVYDVHFRNLEDIRAEADRRLALLEAGAPPDQLPPCEPEWMANYCSLGQRCGCRRVVAVDPGGGGIQIGSRRACTVDLLRGELDLDQQLQQRHRPRLLATHRIECRFEYGGGSRQLAAREVDGGPRSRCLVALGKLDRSEQSLGLLDPALPDTEIGQSRQRPDPQHRALGGRPVVDRS